MSKEVTDCGRCCYFDYFQDTDDYGNYISIPSESCLKGHDLYPDKCDEFHDCWGGK